MSEPVRVFLDWSEATAPAAAKWLRPRARGMLALVPTQEAGRRLRHAMGRDPLATIVTPSQFLQPSDPDIADPLLSALALVEQLSSPLGESCKALFPAGVPARSFTERLALARSLQSLRAELAEHGLSMGEAADRIASGMMSAARWRDLQRLFDAVDQSLGKSGWRDREAARMDALRDPKLPPGIEEIAVVGVGDLQPVIAFGLERSAVPVTILISAPDEPGSFDLWGRPLPSAWTARDPEWRDFRQQIHLVARPDSLELNLEDTNELEIGLLDRELLPVLAETLSATGRAVHDPAGLPLNAHWLIRTLKAFTDLVEDPGFTPMLDLLRNGAIRAWLAQCVSGLDLESALIAADGIRSKHFPSVFRSAQPWIRRAKPLTDAFAPIEAILEKMRADPLGAVEQIASEIPAAFARELDEAESAQLASIREALAEAIERVRIAARHTRLSTKDCLHALQESLSATRIYPPRAEDAIEAVGWLELPWSESSHLVLAGMNLGKAPVPLGSELFLGKSTRAMLGLAGNEERRARDAYFLARILAMRRRVEALVLQMDETGSPLDPSPLLFAGVAESLPERVEFLFAEAPPSKPDPAWTAGWMLDPPVVEMKRTVAATDFQRYLDCPFTFYLNRVVKMEGFEPAADELDAAQFGDLIHTALQGWALDETVKDSKDADLIARTLDEHVSFWVERNLGRSLSLPLRVQIDSARARLSAFANWQSVSRRDGWRIRSIEQSFEQILGIPWQVDGWTISGRIDRIDENERDGRWRVIDYKTFDSAEGPERKHLRAFRSQERVWPPDYARIADSGRWWINLQLPLYRQLLIESGRDPATMTCGYFNLPKTIAETGLQTWESLDEAMQESAMSCMRGVLADLVRRRFWPPNPRADYSDFADFFRPSADRVVDPNGAFVRSCAA